MDLGLGGLPVQELEVSPCSAASSTQALNSSTWYGWSARESVPVSSRSHRCRLRVNAIRPCEVGDALVLEALELVGEVEDPVGQAVGQRRLAEPAVPAARPVRDGLRLQDHDPQ